MDAANHSSAVGSVSPPASSHGDRSAAKRRKLRKGTHSCWDCKRRKIRCIFASPKDKACVNCHRRGAPCIGQDLPEVSSSAVNSHRNIDSKIVRVESLLNDLANKLSGESPNTEKQNEAAQQPSPTNKPSPSHHHHSKPDEPDVTTVNSTTRTLRHNHTSISELLIAALPCHQDTEILLRESQCSALYAHMLNNEQQGLFTKEMYCNKTTSTPPMPTSKTHPVLLARQMLFWCIVLQYPKIDRKHSFREPPRTIMKRIVTAVADLVTTNDDLHGSLESLECIMLEGTYHTYLGNLRRAWLVYRRAMLLAELMGVHRYPAQVLKSLDSEITFHPLSMWYRIVYMDRYLCLLLGLPQGTTDKSMSSIANIQKDPCDIRRFERALSSIAARILERNHHSPSTLSFAHDRAIDTELLDVSRSMPEEFWHIPRFEGVAPGSFEDARTVEPFIAQVYYFQLLNQLHWPYMLRTIHKIRKQDESVNRHEDYSTIACANASREILSRFVAYRSFNHFALCFRPVDLAALTAALTLILTHLDVHLSRGEDPPTVSRCILAHQRMSDRTLLNQVVRKLCMVSEFNEDSMNLEGARLLESLLRVEAEAARGEDYQWTSTSRGDGVQSQDENGDEDEDGDIAIRIPIPCLGSICISRKGCISKQAPGHVSKNPHPHANDTDIYPGIPQAPTSLENIAAYDILTPMTHDGPMDCSRTLEGLTPETTISMGVDASLSGVLLDDGPAISAGMDEWTFQGVDMAFFDSLIMSVPGTSTGGVDGGGEGI